MPEFSMNIQQAKNFFAKMKTGEFRKEALKNMRIDLARSLINNVYVYNLDSIYSIDNANEMRNLMRTGGKPRRGSYHPGYKAWKQAHGLPPHELTGVMKRSTFLDIINETLLFYIPSNATSRFSLTKPRLDPTTGTWSQRAHFFNFGPIHEKRKSVLKSTVVFAWADMKDSILNSYIFGILSEGGNYK